MLAIINGKLLGKRRSYCEVLRIRNGDQSSLHVLPFLFRDRRVDIVDLQWYSPTMIFYLKNELAQDQGSIFRYAAHENTYLNMIYRQLREDLEDIPDREELCSFIRTITTPVNKSKEWEAGPRNMIDMCELVKRYYYDPATKGSNSIKQVLPAILNNSRFLQEKYANPIYGADGGIPSLNYRNWKWIEYVEDRVIDPYKLLPNMFQDISEKDFAVLSDSDELCDGGAALTAYARM